MVTCQLSGGFGNQLCQVAATIAYAMDHEMPFCIPPKTADPSIWPETYFSSDPANYPSYSWVEDYENRDWIWHKEPDNQAYKEIPAFPYVELRGYFQSYKYWQHRLHDIRNTLFPGLYGLPDNTCAIHVRRGDYLKFPVKHPTINVGYVFDAIRYAYNKGVTNFVVYSDDMAWCFDVLGGHLRKALGLLDVKISFPAPGSEREDFINMMCHDHHIISNSSYSKMAAHMRMNPNGIIIAPARWTLEPKQIWDTTDIIPPTWIKI